MAEMVTRKVFIPVSDHAFRCRWCHYDMRDKTKWHHPGCVSDNARRAKPEADHNG